MVGHGPAPGPAATLVARLPQARRLNPYRAVTPAQAAVLRPRYRLSLVKHVRGLTVFLLTRKAGREAGLVRPMVLSFL